MPILVGKVTMWGPHVYRMSGICTLWFSLFANVLPFLCNKWEWSMPKVSWGSFTHGSVWRKLNEKEVMMRRGRVPHDVLVGCQASEVMSIVTLVNYAERSSFGTRQIPHRVFVCIMKPRVRDQKSKRQVPGVQSDMYNQTRQMRQ